MTISNEATKVTVQGNGAQTTFNYNFLIPNRSAAELYLHDSATGSTVLLAASSWQLNDAGNPAGGTFLYPKGAGAPASGTQSLTLLRRVPYTQITNLGNQGAYSPRAVENALDWIVMQIQQLSEISSRLLRAPLQDGPMSALPPAAQRANSYQTFSASGQPQVSANAPPALIPSVFGGTLMQTANNAAARTELGSTATGDAVFTASTPAAARATLEAAAAVDAPPSAWTDVASAAITSLGAANAANLRITGTTTITSFDTAASGARRQLRFAGVLTLTHNPASLILPGGADIITGAGDTAVAVSLGAGSWAVVEYQRAEAAPLPAGSFLRNRLINGGMAVDERNAGAAQTFTAGAALAYSVDRWYGYSTGANVTGRRVAGAVANTFRYQFTGAASVTAIGFGQRLEALNTADLAGRTCTLSVDLANSLLTTVTWTAFYANTTDTFGALASPTRTQIATGTFAVTGTVTRYSATINVPIAATTGIEIVFTVGAQTSGTWTVGAAQLEVGSAPTPFERRQYGQEVALCQRYFYVIPSGDYGFPCPSTGGFAYVQRYDFKATMRAPPTISWVYASTTNLAAINPITANVDYATVQYVGTGANNASWTLNPSTANAEL